MDRRDYLEFWANAREKVKSFDALDDRRMIFGARVRGFGHDYKILPTIPERDLIAFERRTGLSLPLEFRTYLEAFGAGGAGPEYGIYDFRDEGFHMDLSVPFPRSEDVWYPDDPESDSTEDDPVWQLPGLAYICDHGCATYSLIELNGPDPGRVWTEWAEGIMKRSRFVEFYQDWIEKTETRLSQYRQLLTIANREPPFDSDRTVTLDAVIGFLGGEYRTFECVDSDGKPDGSRRLYFGAVSAGHLLINADDELVHVAISEYWA